MSLCSLIVCLPSKLITGYRHINAVYRALIGFLLIFIVTVLLSGVFVTLIYSLLFHLASCAMTYIAGPLTRFLINNVCKYVRIYAGANACQCG